MEKRELPGFLFVAAILNNLFKVGQQPAALSQARRAGTKWRVQRTEDTRVNSKIERTKPECC
jgi:hypothetical protein